MSESTEIVDGRRVPVAIEDEMRGSYLAYAMSVIIGRALPDARDGLKPVHRRILYAMYEQRNFHTSSYKKSARIVGDVIGKYHPHGDTAVYDTMVRMAQDFSMRYELVDGQGNFGSIDGDRAAAMRYTEVRMTRIAGEMLTDIDKDTIGWQENYDGSEKEPTVLPAAIPNLLVNGSGGIAVGMATNMPPHNLTEVVTGTIAVLKNPEITFEELYEIIPGPDFPTGGFIFGKEGIRSAYETGRGIIRMRAKADFEYDENGEEKAIIIHELPYQVNKARLLERIADLVRDKKIEGIRDLRDESDRRGMRVYIELKRGVMGQIVLNQLFTMTPMQSSFGIINLAIVGGQPRVLTLKELLIQFINHRRDVVTRRCRYELRKAQERAHILEGYLLALANIDEIVELIKASATPAEARVALRSRFELTEIQAQSILDMRLQRLTGLEVDKIKEEYAALQEEIKRLQAILGDDDLLKAVIVEELERIKGLYNDPRRTQIINASGSIGMEDLIADEDMVVTITTAGYIKRTPLSDYRTQKRGGRGRSGMNTKSQDEVTNLFVASAHTLLMIFTDRGQVYPLKVWELPMGGINASGKAIVNLIPLEKEESIRSIVPVDDLDVTDQWLVFSTRCGVIKRTVLSQFKNVRNSGIRAINLDDGDDLIQVKLATVEDKVMLVTAKGQSIIFDLDQARPMGRATRGTRGIRLRDGDRVVAMDTVRLEGLPDLEDEHEETEEISAEQEEVTEEVVEEIDANESTIILVTENGYGKRSRLAHFRVQKRGGLGLRALPYSPRNGELISMCQVRPAEDLMVVTDGGTIIRMAVNDVRTYSRYAKGVRVISVPKGEQVVSIFSVAASSEDDDVELDEEGNVIEREEGAEGSEVTENVSEDSETTDGTDSEVTADEDTE